jgi:adenine-specific DNA-methyltransferase
VVEEELYMEKLKMHSPDLTAKNIERLMELFPGCVTEIEAGNHETHEKHEKKNYKKAIDFDLLRQELSGNIVEGPQERYHLDWPGKREALLAANAPIAKTLRPCREESVDFDATKNLFIEGDNLDVLKLLQETYLGKVKIIYIDPPYNKGNDFIYDDDFAENAEDFLKRSNQKDEKGNRLVANTEANGRFHSDWLSMMYPRLKLAKNLLREDGAIFISIDDNEIANMRKLCDEVFGEKNFVGQAVWQKKYSPQNDAKHLSELHEYIVVYARTADIWRPELLPRSQVAIARYKNPDNDPRGPWKVGDLTSKTKAAGHSYPIESPGGKVFYPTSGRQWAPSQETFKKLKEDNRIWFGANEGNVPSLKQFLSEVQDGTVPTTLWLRELVGDNQEAMRQLSGIGIQFDSPKPVGLIGHILKIGTTQSNSDLVLDFYGGSGTTAHAVMQLNAEDGGNRKFIMVQLPEPCDEKSEAFKAGYKTIADIGKERIRRAGRKIKEELTTKDTKNTKGQGGLFSEAEPENVRVFREFRGSTDLDTGFRVLKVDSSNLADIYYNPDAVTQKQLSLFAENIKEDRTPEDLLFQVLLDWGVDLSLPVKKEMVSGKEVFFVDENALAACFVKNGEINEDFCKQLAVHKPLRVVFRDAGFKNDSVKINAEQIFKLMSPHTEVKTI